MIEQVAIAFEHKDYQTAAKLLKQLLTESPENPWVQFYLARLHEVSQKRQDAEKIYRQLLRVTTNTKIVTQARQGLRRLQEIEQEERQRAISQATAEPSNSELGILVLEPLSNEHKNRSISKIRPNYAARPLHCKAGITKSWLENVPHWTSGRTKILWTNSYSKLAFLASGQQ